MTGNNKVWRAPLAGLASVAMIATMGVAASTANALDSDAVTSAFDTVGNATVKVYNADYPYNVDGGSTAIDDAIKAYGYEEPMIFSAKYGESLDADDLEAGAPGAGIADHKVLDYLSYDQAGKNKATVPYVVTGDVKLYAHYKDSVTVTFDTNENGYADSSDPKVQVAKGSKLTYADYVKVFGFDAVGAPNELAAPAGQQFAGWTLTPSASGKGTSDLYNGAAITANTVLYPRFDSGTNLATVRFQEQGNQGNVITRYTLVDSPFQEFRAPLDWTKSFSDAAFAGWTVDGAKYDFTTPVKNVPGSALSDVDLKIIASKSNSLKNVKVKYIFNTGDADLRTADDYTTTTDQKVKEPVNPVKAGYVFTGWYTEPTATGVVSNKFNFDTAIDQQPGLLSNGTLTLYAGWNKVNAAKLVFNLGYTDSDFLDAAGKSAAQQVLYVYAGSKVDLPAGLEEYSQTAAQKDALKGEFTAKTLKGWYEGNDP
ncbi:InlB B-repeat-containing protein, partial [Bifidobacterium sp. UTBIF-78]|uniref:InlB B-repeat-containing protein n=1 Tax=Bifidobacterium sp. UTBIF-78 TaxID=1465263 RepID=UPI0015E3F1BA